MKFTTWRLSSVTKFARYLSDYFAFSQSNYLDTIVKILNFYIILLCSHLYHFFPVSMHYLHCIHCLFVVYFDQRMHACARICMVENDQKHSKIRHFWSFSTMRTHAQAFAGRNTQHLLYYMWRNMSSSLICIPSGTSLNIGENLILTTNIK